MASAAIIGGYGGMGRLFAKVLKQNGLRVVLTGPQASKGKKAAKALGVAFEKDNKKAASSADIVIITVPINKTVTVIKEIAPIMKKGSLLMDLTSIKKEPCNAMAKAVSKEVEVVGCHPLFGPTTTSLKDQNVIFCPIRSGKNFLLIGKIMRKEHASITVCTPEEHDEAMGVVQGLTHFLLISTGVAMRDVGFHPEKSKEFSTPVSNLISDLVGRVLGQDAGMCFEIQLNGPAKKVREAYLQAAERLNGSLGAGNEEAFVKAAEAAAKHFGDTSGAMERTNKLLKK